MNTRASYLWYIANKRFTNTSTNAKFEVSIKFEHRYLENQTLQAAEILKDFVLHGPLKVQPMVRNKTDEIPIKIIR